ncbi:MAG TPA: type II toxin-antitoxin system HicB family antitoxin [Ktedonobacterales bacterium]|nr:type II toxin-antitoxin system HicB family antitoxin [Ktedonobacterales bacterium]
MYRYLVIVEAGEQNLSAYVPDLPGCVATGTTREQLERNMREAIELHLHGMLEDGDQIPAPSTTAEYIEVSPPAA